MFFTYLRRELRRRMRQAIFISVGLALGLGLVITVTAASSGVKAAQGTVLQNLSGGRLILRGVVDQASTGVGLPGDCRRSAAHEDSMPLALSGIPSICELDSHHADLLHYGTIRTVRLLWYDVNHE